MAEISHKKRGKVLLVLSILTILVIVLFAVGAILVISSNKDGNEVVVTPDPDEDKKNVIDLDNEIPNYKSILSFIEIKPDDTIVGYSELGKQYDLQLQRGGWSSMQLSPENNFLAVLSDSSENADLNLFDFNSAKWEKITDFSNFDSGISSFIWGGEDILFFVQGEGINSWLHKYDMRSGDTTKLKQLNAELLSISPDMESILVYDEFADSFLIIDTTGELVWDSQTVKTNSGNNLNIDNVVFSKNSIKFVLSNPNNSNFKQNIGEEEVVLINASLGMDLICSTGEDSFLFIHEDANPDNIAKRAFNLVEIDVRQDIEINRINITPNSNSSEFLVDDFNCRDVDNIIFSLSEEVEEDLDIDMQEENTGKIWYKTDLNEVFDVPFLEGEEVIKF